MYMYMYMYVCCTCTCTLYVVKPCCLLLLSRFPSLSPNSSILLIFLLSPSSLSPFSRSLLPSSSAPSLPAYSSPPPSLSLSIAETDAVGQIINFMGMQPCERSDKVDSNKPSHTLLLAGVYRGGHDVLVRARLAMSQGVTMKITVRGDDIIACETIAAAVG